MPFRALAFVLACLCCAVPAMAQVAPQGVHKPVAREEAVAKVLKLPEILAIMGEEGISYGKTLQEDLFPRSGGRNWQAAVAAIYSPEAMNKQFLPAFAEQIATLSDTQIAEVMAFFGSERGRNIVALEVSARRLHLDDAHEEASRQRLDQMATARDPRLEELTAFIAANDLIESNVTGAMNANYAFYRGLVDGGAFPFEMSDAEILGDVWAQEEDIRIETEDWLYGYLATAYAPLSDEDMAAYIAFSRTPAGVALNQALFAAYDVLFTQISYDLGRAAARYLAGEEL